MSDTFFGKGIAIASGFDLGAKIPLDSRLVAETLDELQEHIDNNRAYEGMMVYVKETQLTYQYLGERWMVFTNGGGSGHGTSIIIDDLNSVLVNASLSANQGRVLHEMIEMVQSNFYTKEEIDHLHEILNNKDLQFEEKFNNISNYLPRTLSSFINDMNFVTEENFEEVLSGIEIPIKTSQLENDAGYITEENLEENVIGKIPIKTSQLVNDSNYITEENLYMILEDMNLDGIISNGFVHIGNDLPPDKKYLWIDTSTPSNLNVINYNERVKLKYVEMLSLVKTRLSNLSSKLNLIENNINKISSNNADKISTFKSTLGSTKSQISILILQIVNLTSKETIEKEESKKLRKESKRLLYYLSDFNDEVMRVLDNELKLDISGGDSDDNNDIQTDGASLLTEDGFVLLTEDGLMLLADGVATSTILADAILTELGLAILTEDGKQILKG